MISKINNWFVLIPLWLIAVIIPFVLVANSTHYFLNIHALGILLTSYFIGALGITIASKGLNQKDRQELFLLSLCFFLWLWSIGIAYLCKFGEVAHATIWYRVANTAVAFIAAQFYSFTVAFLKLERKRLVSIGYIIGGVFALLSIFTRYFISELQWFRWGYYPHWEVLRTLPFMGYFSIGLGLTLVEFIQVYRLTQSEHLKNQIKYILIAFAISYLGSVDYLTAFGYNVYPSGYVAIFGWWTILAYAILKHRLMDITVIIRKTLVYSVVMGSLTTVYLLTIGLFARIFQGYSGYQTIYSSALAAGLITFCFHPLRKRVQHFVDTKFFRQYVDRQEKLYELSREVITHTTPEAMGGVLLRVIDEALHPKSGVLFLRSREGSGFIRVSDLGSVSLPIRMDEDNELAKYCKDHPQPFVLDLNEDMAHSQNTRAKTGREDVA